MIGLLFIVPWYFFRSALHFLLGIKSTDRVYYSGKFMLDRADLRLPAESSRSPFIGIKFFIQTLQKIWRNSSPDALKQGNSPSAILDARLQNQTLRSQYVKACTGESPGWFITNTSLIYGKGIFHKILLSLMINWSFSWLLIPTIFSSKRANYALMIPDMVRTYNLLLLLRKHQINKLYYFFIFENWSNVAALLLEREKVYVTKVTSISPLFFHGQIMIADELAVNTRYQFEEAEVFKDTIFVKKISQWMPELGVKLLGKYKDFDHKTTPKNTLGFYSSGYQHRIRVGEVDTGFGELESDSLLMDFLKKYLIEHPEVTLKIFLHPIEKRSAEALNLAEKHYNTFFEGCSIEVIKGTSPTMEHLGEVDIAIGVISGSLGERLFFGFKTIYTPFAVKGFPYSGISLEKICAKKPADLADLLDRSLKQEVNDFFRKNGLEEYRYKS